VAFSPAAGEPTEIVHSDLRARYEQGDAEVLRAMKFFANLAQQFRDECIGGDCSTLPRLIDENFDLRSGICRMQRQHREMIETARAVGATAKFAGSGGAIVGSYRDPTMFGQLVVELEKLGCRVMTLSCD